MKKNLLALAVLLSLSAAPGPEKRNFLLVTIDTWRADYLSASGSGRVQTPFLDKLVREGAYLSRVDAPAPLTTPSHASILTGLYPKDHGIRDNSHFKLREGIATLPQLFKEKGYRTMGVVSAAPLRKRYGLSRGFDLYEDDGIGVEGDEALVPSARDARRSAARAADAAKAAKGDNLFLWLHLYDPHFPYAPPPEFRERYPQDPYAGEVAYVDRVLGDFVARLQAEKKGRWTVLVTGDHGEALGEKGEMMHGFLLYKQTREVPLILWDSEKRPGSFGAGPKSLVDIFPTVAELFSLRSQACDGISLFRNTPGGRWLYSEAFGPLMDFGLNPALLVRKDDRIYIRHGTPVEIYQGTDEDKNLSGVADGFAAAAEAEAKRFFGDATIPAPTLKMGDEEARALASLGYIGHAPAPHAVSPCDLRAFSKDFTKYYSRADEERDRGNLEKALQDYGAMAAKYPNSPVLHVDKGYVLMDLERFGEAKAEFLACLKLDPKNSNALLNLGYIMEREGKPGEAEKLYSTALKYEEDKASAHLNLGTLYAEMGQGALAMKHLKRFLELAPRAPQRESVESLLKTLK